MIQYNISNVDNEILPQLKGCVNKISEVKQHLSHIKREQIKALENEEVLMKELNELNSEKKKKIESMAQVKKIYLFCLIHLFARIYQIILRDKIINLLLRIKKRK